jgi:hypothetical protein
MYAHFKKLLYFSTECLYAPFAARGFARTYIKVRLDTFVGCEPPQITVVAHQASGAHTHLMSPIFRIWSLCDRALSWTSSRQPPSSASCRTAAACLLWFPRCARAAAT